MDAFHFLETERHLKFDVGRGIGIMGQFLVVVIAVFGIAESEGFMPAQTGLFPAFEPFEFFAGTHKELHLHLLELAHAEYELACHDFVAECFAYLGYTERYAHAACLLYVKIVDKYALSCLGAQIYSHGTVSGRTHFRAEHEIELTNFGPVFGA